MNNATGISDFPRLAFSMPPDFPCPNGFIGATELLEYTLGVRWGRLLEDCGFVVEGHPVSANTRLGKSATSGQLNDAISLVREACANDELEAFVPHDPNAPDPSRFLRITPADWRGLDFDRSEMDLMTGSVFRYRDEPMAWAENKPIYFRVDQAAHWLGSLSTPHNLTKPARCDPGSLPDRPFIFLSECVTWLAGIETLDALGLQEWKAIAAVRVDALAKGCVSETDQLCEPGEDFSADRWFANFLCERIRVHLAKKELLRAMASGQLVGHGRKQLGRNTTDVQRLPKETFLLTVELVTDTDGIALDQSVPVENQDNDAFLNGANWKDIRFARDDVVRLWCAEHSEQTSATEDAASKPKPKKGGRPREYDWPGARKEFDRLIEYHGLPFEGDPEWNAQSRVEEAILKWFTEKDNRTPGKTAIKTHVSKWLHLVDNGQ